MDIRTWDVNVVKSEPDAIPEEYGIVKQEMGNTSKFKCEPGTLADLSLPEMDFTRSGVIKSEPDRIREEDSPTSHWDAILQYGIVKQEIEDHSASKCEPETLADCSFPEINLTTSCVGFIKVEPVTTREEESTTSHCDPILQYRIAKPETEDASAIKCKPEKLVAEEHAQRHGACSEIDIEFSDVKKEYLLNQEKIDHSRVSISSKSSNIGTIDPKAKQPVKGKKSYSCPTCSYRCNNKTDFLLHHISTHTEEKPFTCLKCNDRFYQKSDLISHSKIHIGEKPYACSECSYKSRQQSALVIHIQTHTGEKPFSCSECTFRCIRQNDLVRHIRTHTGEKPFSCPECTFSCSIQSSLNRHIRTHTGEKPFSCQECTFRCIRKNDLVRHIRTHTGEKPFSCQECTFSCSEQSSLIRHIRTHTGEKPFSCSECYYRCSEKSALVLHIRKHTGEKPFSCSECSYRCSRKNAIVHHIRTHTGENKSRARNAH